MYKYCSRRSVSSINSVFLSPKSEVGNSSKSFFIVIIVSIANSQPSQEATARNERRVRQDKKSIKLLRCMFVIFFHFILSETHKNTQVSAQGGKNKKRKVFLRTRHERGEKMCWKRKMAAISECVCKFFLCRFSSY